jgi:hypothetical protein
LSTGKEGNLFKLVPVEEMSIANVSAESKLNYPGMGIQQGVVKSIYLDEEDRVLCEVVLEDGSLLRDLPIVGETKPYPGSGIVVVDKAVALIPNKEFRVGNWLSLPDAKLLAADSESHVSVSPWYVTLTCGPVVFSLNRKLRTTSLVTGNLLLRTPGLEIHEYDDTNGRRVFVIRGSIETEKGDKRKYNWILVAYDGKLILKYCSPDDIEQSNSTITLTPTTLELKVSGSSKASAIRITEGQVEINTPHLLVKADKADFVKGCTEGKQKCNLWQD